METDFEIFIGSMDNDFDCRIYEVEDYAISNFDYLVDELRKDENSVIFLKNFSTSELSQSKFKIFITNSLCKMYGTNEIPN